MNDDVFKGTREQSDMVTLAYHFLLSLIRKKSCFWPILRRVWKNKELAKMMEPKVQSETEKTRIRPGWNISEPPFWRARRPHSSPPGKQQQQHGWAEVAKDLASS